MNASFAPTISNPEFHSHLRRSCLFLLIFAALCVTSFAQPTGTIIGWGNNSDSQLQAPPGISGVVKVAAGNVHSLALKNDGTVAGWGFNVFGQATPPPGLSGVTAIAAGLSYSMALKTDGSVTTWGDAPLDAPVLKMLSPSPPAGPTPWP